MNKKIIKISIYFRQETYIDWLAKSMLSNMWSIIKNKRNTSSFRDWVKQIRKSKWVRYKFNFFLRNIVIKYWLFSINRIFNNSNLINNDVSTTATSNNSSPKSISSTSSTSSLSISLSNNTNSYRKRVSQPNFIYSLLKLII